MHRATLGATVHGAGPRFWLRSSPESPVAAPKKMEELTIACLQVLFKILI